MVIYMGYPLVGGIPTSPPTSMGYPLVICYSLLLKMVHLQLIYIVKMVIFHSYVTNYQRVSVIYGTSIGHIRKYGRSGTGESLL